MKKSALINCPTCGKSISSKAPTCPHCGEKIALGKCRSLKLGICFIIGIAIMILIAFIGDKIDNKTTLSVGIWGLIICLLGMAVCFTSPSGR